MSVQPHALPRGIRNNNPGNLRPGFPWQGVDGIDNDQPKPPYLKFISPEWGIRALARTLMTYQERHGIHTLAAAFARWAPAGDGNDPVAYAASVARELGKDPADEIDLHDQATLSAIAAAIVREENGLNNGQPWYLPIKIQAGVALAFPPYA